LQVSVPCVACRLIHHRDKLEWVLQPLYGWRVAGHLIHRQGELGGVIAHPLNALADAFRAPVPRGTETRDCGRNRLSMV